MAGLVTTLCITSSTFSTEPGIEGRANGVSSKNMENVRRKSHINATLWRNLQMILARTDLWWIQSPYFSYHYIT